MHKELSAHMRIISEYEPVQKLLLSFVQDFFNSRFKYGRAICEISRVASNHTSVEILVSEPDKGFLQKEMDAAGLDPDSVTLNFDSPQRGIMAEYVPVFADTGTNGGAALIFKNSCMEHPEFLLDFSRRLATRLGFEPLEMNDEFATAAIIVNEDVCLLSKDLLAGDDGKRRREFFETSFSRQRFYVVPSLADEVTNDLDTYLWPIRPGVWLISEYPQGTPQARSIAPAVEVLERVGHEVFPIPGLARLAYDDINTIPNYANGILLNNVALCPKYNCPQDEIVVGLLERFGYEVHPVDCSDIILSNSGLHCISKTVPKIPARTRIAEEHTDGKKPK